LGQPCISRPSSLPVQDSDGAGVKPSLRPW
jgi:hypothetical protein